MLTVFIAKKAMCTLSVRLRKRVKNLSHALFSLVRMNKVLWYLQS